MYRQSLAQVFGCRFDFVSIQGRVAKTEDSNRCVDCKPVKFSPGRVVFSLEQAVDKTNGRSDIVEKITNPDTKTGDSYLFLAYFSHPFHSF